MENTGSPVEEAKINNAEIINTRSKEGDQDLGNQLSMAEANTKGSLPDKVPYIKGEKTIICWNCLSVLMVKEEWSVVQCTNCEKINRVPGIQGDISSQIRLNDNMNHFDIYLPYVYVIVSCPFCQTENKVKRDAEHVVCFKCHNSVSIQRYSRPSPVPQYTNQAMPNIPNRSLRYSDLPNNDKVAYYPPPNNCCNHNSDGKLEYMLMLHKLQNKIDKLSQPIIIDRYEPLRRMINKVDEIGERRRYTRNSGTPGSFNYYKFNKMKYDDGEDYIYGKHLSNKIPVNRYDEGFLSNNYTFNPKYNPDPMSYQANSYVINHDKSKAIYNTMFKTPTQSKHKYINDEIMTSPLRRFDR